MSNIASVNHIITAKHMGGGSLEGYWRRHIEGIRQSRGFVIPLEVSTTAKGLTVMARIYRGQWIADCECGGASFVDPEDPRFFCFSCANRANAGQPRPVIFPENYNEIERVILERPVDDMAGLTDNERANSAKPLIGAEGKGLLWREWNPGETLEELHKQQDDAVKAWKKNIKAGK